MPNALTYWAIRARRLLSHVFEHWLWRYRYFWSKVNIWYIDCARATAFIFDTLTGVLVKVSKLHPLQSVVWNYLSIPKLQRCNRWSLGMDKWFHPTLFWACDYSFMLGLRLNHVSKRGRRKHVRCSPCVTQLDNTELKTGDRTPAAKGMARIKRSVLCMTRNIMPCSKHVWWNRPRIFPWH